MEIIIGIIVALFGGLIFYKKKADKSAVDAKLGETKGKDAVLEEAAAELKAQIAEIDNNLEKIRKDKEAERVKSKNLTLAERRERIKKGLK